MDNGNAAQQRFRWDVAMDAVYLMGCALHDSVPDLTRVGDLDALYRFCAKHSVGAMVAMALESAWRTQPPEDGSITAPWKQIKEKSIRKNILLNAERERILAYLDSIGCWYMPLKGSFLQHDYPRFGMRQMSDNDILFDTAFAEQIRDFMCQNGYTVENFALQNHDEYTKAPVYNFEMHRRLFNPLTDRVLTDYYSNHVHRLMRKDENNRFGYHLSSEDFYVYLTAHAYKHFSHRGIGIRTLVDEYVFLTKHEASLDWAYVEKELETLGILDYERQCRAMARKLFAQPGDEILLSESEGSFLARFLGAGTFGNEQQAVENALEQMGQAGTAGGLSVKVRYFWSRMFPSVEFMEEEDPQLRMHPWLLPFSYIRRLVMALFQKPMKVIREIQNLVRSKGNTKK